MRCLITAALCLIPLALPWRSAAQELDCEITIAMERLTSVEARENLSDFEDQIKNYVNNHRWTKEDFGEEKIKCAINFSFLGVSGSNRYLAQAFIGSQRPIFKAGRNTAVTRFIDDKLEFEYTRGASLTHSDSRFDPLLAVLDYYAYIILGFDTDTYKSGGGTPYFQKALEIVGRAQGVAGAGKGWEAGQPGSFTRQQLVDELMNPKLGDYRKAVHTYYYRGLDSLALNPERARRRILSALEKLAKLRDKINQPSVLMRTFLETKYPEIAEAFLDDPDPAVYRRLSQLDPAHQTTYEEYAARRR